MLAKTRLLTKRSWPNIAFIQPHAASLHHSLSLSSLMYMYIY